MTVDFVADDGALTCGKAAQDAVAPILMQLRHARDRGELIVFACDAHTKEDPEFELWPVHCVEGTEGAELFGELRDFYEENRGDRVRYMPKTRYDAFYDTPLEQWLQSEGAREVVVMGVCTSICCYATASGAYYRRLRVLYDPEGMADLTPESHAFAMQQMQAVLKAHAWPSERQY